MEYYIQLLRDFNIPLYEPNMSNPNRYIAYDGFDDKLDLIKDTLQLVGGEILKIKWYKPAVITNYAYCQIIGYYKGENFIKVESVSSLSKEFIYLNISLFNDITLSFQRDLKINEVIR